MNPNMSEHESKSAGRASVVDAVFDTALAWVDTGLGRLQTSLDASARAIDRAAIALDTVREKLRT